MAGGISRFKAILITAASGFPTVLGALLGYMLGSIGPFWHTLSLSFASGAMLYVVFGSVNTLSSAAITTLNGFGGTITHNGTGTITTANLDGSELDLTDSGLARTVTTLNLDAGGIIKYDPSVVTITTQNEASVPVRISANNA